MPLAFTQEDFLVLVDFWDLRLSRTNYTGLEGHENDNQQRSISRALTSI